MAQNTDITLTEDDWTQLTNANVTAISFQNKGDYYILIKGTTDATKPTNENGSIVYDAGQGEKNCFLSDLFTGITAVRVWAYSPKKLKVFVSHA